MRYVILFAAFFFLFVPTSASAQVVWDSTSTPYPGVEIKSGHLVSPLRYFRATYVDLCADYVHVTATAPAATRQTTGAWANSVGAQVAVNGDFFQYTTPPSIYGDAVGNGEHWPLNQTGVDDNGEWYYRDYGWIAIGEDWVEFNHTRRTKNNADAFEAAGYTVSGGWNPDGYTAEIPPNTISLVSGFPELVIEGKVRTCPDPAGGADCFGDRGDMRDRHIRSAMGITEDRQQLIFITTSSSVLGVTLAEIAFESGAWQAFNTDGGGSTSLWTQAQGYIRPTGAPRAVGNHWGIFAGADNGKAQNPSACHRLGGCLPNPVSDTDDSEFADFRTAWNGYERSKTLYEMGAMNACGTTDTKPLMCPRCEITRGEFAFMVARAAGLPIAPPATATFSDVPVDHPYFAEIEAFVAAGITNGCGDGTSFCVDAPLIRAHAAAFLVRAAGWTPCAGEVPSFGDVPIDHTFYDEIETVKKNCVVNGCSETDFCPNRRLRRGNAALMVARTFDIDDSNDCFDFCADGTVAGIDVMCDGNVTACPVSETNMDAGSISDVSNPTDPDRGDVGTTDPSDDRSTLENPVDGESQSGGCCATSKTSPIKFGWLFCLILVVGSRRKT